MAIPSSSQSKRSESEMVSESPPVMPPDLYEAAIKGYSGVLMQRLGLQSEEVTIEADQQDLQDVIGSVTHFGDTLLHLLVTQMHNELALMVFKRDMSLMKARNKKSETPLHSAAKVGNVDFIRALSQCAADVVKDVVRETDNNGDTALHLAAKHGHEGVARELMKLESGVAYMFNKEELSPLYIATVGGYTPVAITILQEAPSLACEQYSNGMFPVHVAAGAGNRQLVMHFMYQYPDDVKLLDHCRRNLFHIAAEENKVQVFKRLQYSMPRELWGSLINTKDYEGNTPLHIATIKEHTSVMIAISKHLTSNEEAVQNNQERTPFELWRNQIRKTATKDTQRNIDLYFKDKECCFTQDLFDQVLKSDQNKWDRIQVIGLGSVLVTTVTFAAAFAIPGGYQDNGTPILGRKYMFKAFMLANALSFTQAFASIFGLISVALVDPDAAKLYSATITFTSAAGCMVLAFGLGSYVILAPASLPIAVIVLIIVNLLLVVLFMNHYIINILLTTDGYDFYKWTVVHKMALCELFIFLLALA